LKNNSEKSVKPRESGHYWVKWYGLETTPYDVWRIGAYYQETGTWYLIDDNRVYYDGDFIEINENRIPFPFRWGHSYPLLTSLIFWACVLMTILNAIITLYYIIQ
jgi:hypothetical protein